MQELRWNLSQLFMATKHQIYMYQKLIKCDCNFVIEVKHLVQEIYNCNMVLAVSACVMFYSNLNSFTIYMPNNWYCTGDVDQRQN